MEKYYSTKLKTIEGKFGEFYSFGITKEHCENIIRFLEENNQDYFNFQIAKSKAGEMYIKPNVQEKPKTYTRQVVDEDDLDEIPF
jgi:hypothetical protein